MATKKNAHARAARPYARWNHRRARDPSGPRTLLLVGLTAYTARNSSVVNIRRTYVCALIDRSAPRTGLGLFGLNERPEPLKVALGTILNDVELVPYVLQQTLRLVLQREIDPGLTAANVFERDGASVRGALSGCPRNPLIGHLLQDLCLPLTAYAGDLGNPLKTVVSELLHALHTLHELRKVLKLRPLVIYGAYWDIDQHRFLDVCRHHILLSARLPLDRQPCRHLIAVVSDPIPLPRSGCTKPAHSG